MSDGVSASTKLENSATRPSIPSLGAFSGVTFSSLKMRHQQYWHGWRGISPVTGGCFRPDPAPGRPLTLARRPEPSADLLRQLDDDPLRAADVAEPIAVLVALHLANELRAGGLQATGVSRIW